MIPRFRSDFVVLFCLVALLSVNDTAGAQNSDDSPPNSTVSQTVSDWFEKYDQIRRDCEMSTTEKLKYGNALKKALKSGGKLSASTQAFVKKMRDKYESAIGAMNALPATPETKELQEGYVQYFTEMERAFSECLSMQEVSSASQEAKAMTKENLEKINSKNKKIDQDLRAKFGIPKHKHS